jgi:dodecin
VHRFAARRAHLPARNTTQEINPEETMSVAKVIEISAESPDSFEDAIRQGIAQANKSLRNVKGAWIKEHEAVIQDGKITAFRVDMKVTFLLD